ncbi:MAG TPA: flavin reductase, partial [Hyphomonas sp.]|nr:flavin reductase [Hyphomonas sp.]
RDALGCFATGVTIVTALNQKMHPIGLTANSFTSVSLDPPLLLVCIAKTAGSLEALRAAAYFGVNVLHIGQQTISNRFAKPGEDRFAQTSWQSGHH